MLITRKREVETINDASFQNIGRRSRSEIGPASVKEHLFP